MLQLMLLYLYIAVDVLSPVGQLGGQVNEVGGSRVGGRHLARQVVVVLGVVGQQEGGGSVGVAGQGGEGRGPRSRGLLQKLLEPGQHFYQPVF